LKFEIVKRYEDLYDTLPSLCNFNSDAKWAVVARSFNLIHLKVITPLDIKTDNSHIANFIRSTGPCVQYPLTFGKAVFGYAFRSLSDKNFILLCYSPMYIYSSFRSMRGHLGGENFVYGVPVAISEGVLDAEAVSLAWPFSYACLTNHLSDCQAQFISMFTTKVIYFQDNDEAGDKGAKVSVNNLKRYGVSCFISRMGNEYKDLVNTIRQRYRTNTVIFENLG
jgi:hypothetical protein